MRMAIRARLEKKQPMGLLRFIAGIVPFCFLIGCGGGLPHSSDASVSVAPVQASVKAGSTVTLTGTDVGFTQSPIVDWWIQESKAKDFNNDCGKLDTQKKDFTGCPYGFVMFHDVTTVPSTAVYYAPATPGIYHATLQMTEVCCWFDSLTRTANAAITVTE